MPANSSALMSFCGAVSALLGDAWSSAVSAATPQPRTRVRCARVRPHRNRCPASAISDLTEDRASTPSPRDISVLGQHPCRPEPEAKPATPAPVCSRRRASGPPVTQKPSNRRERRSIPGGQRARSAVRTGMQTVVVISPPAVRSRSRVRSIVHTIESPPEHGNPN